MDKFFKNDYKIRKDLTDFANNNPVGKILKPFLKDTYKTVNKFFPFPRDFLIRKFPRNAIGCEIGVYGGDFTERIVRINPPQKIYLIDPWQALVGMADDKYNQAHQDKRYQTVQNKFGNNPKIHIVRKSSDEAVSLFSDNFFDFIYIDGDHSYSQVKKDLENYFPKVKKNGLLCGDDYHLSEVKKAVDEFVAEEKLSLQTRNNQFMIS